MVAPLAKFSLLKEDLDGFCRKWQIGEFAVFGSVLRNDFAPDSDVDVLITFAPGGRMTFESFLEMREELSQMFGDRSIDLVEKRLLRNPFRRHRILTTRQVLYGA
jgi:uncharacterized protein